MYLEGGVKLGKLPLYSTDLISTATLSYRNHVPSVRPGAVCKSPTTFEILTKYGKVRGIYHPLALNSNEIRKGEGDYTQVLDGLTEINNK